MKRPSMILALLGLLVFVAIPAASSVSAQERYQRTYNQRDQNYDRNRDRHRRSDNDDWNRNHRKYTHGYRNYGQYRRTQVGNRRYVNMRNSYYYRHHRRYTRDGGYRNN